MSGAAAILAVDGGNSKVDVALASADGVVLGAARGGRQGDIRSEEHTLNSSH